MVFQIPKNALFGRFFIALLLYFATGYCYSNPNLPDTCVSTNFKDEALVKKVIDGDTVILVDERHIRLVGINTPELDHDNYSKSEPGAIRARDRLANLLEKKPVYLDYDKERFDRHGRTLAHLYLVNGTNVQATLLIEGLAIPLTIPPNLDNHHCYELASELARRNKKGLWKLAAYQPVNVITLTGKEQGFRFIRGKIRQISESRSSLWINLENNVALRIVKADLQYFNIDNLKLLTNKIVEAHGWLYRKNNQLRMRIRHPSNIKVYTLRN